MKLIALIIDIEGQAQGHAPTIVTFLEMIYNYYNKTNKE